MSNFKYYNPDNITSDMISTLNVEYGPIIAAMEVVGNPAIPRKAGFKSVQLRQTVKKIYGRGLNDSIYGDNSGAREIESTRTVILNNIREEDSLEDVQSLLNGLKFARLYEVLSHEPILTPQLKSAVEMGRTSVEDQEEKQRVRDHEGCDIADSRTGQLMYKLVVFSVGYKGDFHPDIELREYAAAPERMPTAVKSPEQEM